DHALQMRELLVQIAAQPLELLWFAQLLGGDGFVMSRDEAAIVRPPRLVLTMSARTPRLGRGLRVTPLRVVRPLFRERPRRLRLTQLGVVRHPCGERLRRLSRRIGCVLASNVGLIEAGLRVLGISTLPVFPGFLLATILFSLLAFFLVGFGTAVLPHVERVEQVVNDISEARLVFDEPL